MGATYQIRDDIKPVILKTIQIKLEWVDESAQKIL